jgi:hypothetical protein
MGKDMDLNFEIFMIVLLVLSILVVANFLRDGESNYLEGSLLVVSQFLASLWCSHCVATLKSTPEFVCTCFPLTNFIDCVPYCSSCRLVLSES